jgi:predicted membrane-bound dolichyl-phosphate-mannose-protein mannosyltransferase
MVSRRHAWAVRRPALSLWLLGAVLLVSLGARVAWLGDPCRSPCRSANDHLLIFDEDYYVNAARVIAGIRPPHGAPYANAPLGTDPNSEHPQLVKLIIAGSIELFGDGPFAWRLGSLVLGCVAILGMWALVRAAGGGRWLALGAAALMASDNLLLVHSRIGTLDIYAVAAMVWASALYLRGRPWLAGAVIGVGTCAKEVTPYVLLGLVVLEVFRSLSAGSLSARAAALAGLRRLAACVAAFAVVFVGLLDILDGIAPPYSPQTGKLVPGGPFGHISHIVRYAANETSPSGPHGIASYPWDWLFDYKPITYLNINPSRPVPGLEHVHPAAHFLGVMNPVIMLLALPSLLFTAYRLFGRGWAGIRASASSSPNQVGLVGLAWVLGTYLPFVFASLLDSRISYIYYMAIVMPGIYLTVADLVARIGPRRLSLAWMACVLVAAVVLYPFTPLP